MPAIIVDDTDAEIINNAPVVEIRDKSGRLIGLVTKDLLEDIEIAQERVHHPTKGMTTGEMLDWLERGTRP